MSEPSDYLARVYAGVLGKVIGVYFGRPFEGWDRARIAARWDEVDHYVNDELAKPLVVADDDISGTFTFVRALEDSGRYAETPADFFGDCWLDYLIEHRTVLWWGGMRNSTEHTAYLRLKQGLRAPQSGAIASNGRTVAEQIGAQIFIDAFGLVAPGQPALAARLARRAAAVSHDGEAVHAAAVVAAMVSAAFVEPAMDRLLDVGLSVVPNDCLIAQVHRDVREWSSQYADWRDAFEPLRERYGYHRYGGNCHVVPNHAVMVLAWCYAAGSFRRALTVAASAGWDTDCNVGNVGAVVGVQLGLAAIDADYDFRGPIADRLIIPTADGTHACSDCAQQALRIAQLGRRLMSWPDQPPPKDGAWHHFALPGAVHGYKAEQAELASVQQADNALAIDFRLDGQAVARVSTPILPAAEGQGYGIVATPRLHPGDLLEADICCSAPVVVKLFVGSVDGTVTGAAMTTSGGNQTLALRVPALAGWPVQRCGFELSSPQPLGGRLVVRAVRKLHQSRLRYQLAPRQEQATGAVEFAGWIAVADQVRGSFSEDPEPLTYVGKNEGRGYLVTGTTDWRDVSISARLNLQRVDSGGLIVRYCGLQRFIWLRWTSGKLELVRQWYGEQVLATTADRWDWASLPLLRLTAAGTRLRAAVADEWVLEAECDRLLAGGAGFVWTGGLLGLREISIDAGLNSAEKAGAAAPLPAPGE